MFELKARTAHIIRKGLEEEIPIEQIKLGDCLIVRPGEKIPTDGVIEKGTTFVNQSAITGESIPVLKKDGDEVIGATINTDGLIEIRATKVGKDTVLSNIIKLVEDAKNSKLPLQNIVDKVSAYFVPTIILVAISSGLLWYFVGQIGLTFSLLAFVSVIIIACPCAIGIATPAALMVGSSKSAENGILIKGGENLEVARRIQSIVFDKTGTLTTGKIIVTEVVSFGEMSDTEVLRLCSIAEQGSEHPLGKAVLKHAQEKGIAIKNPDSFRAESGMGIVATDQDHEIIVGNRQMLIQNKIPIENKTQIEKIESSGKTTIYVALDKQIVGGIVLQDQIKENAVEAIRMLKNRGIEIAMVTGDNKTTANMIGKELGIDKIFYDILPAD
ncbi:MAG: heavy metal translocating P-type ATPase, partial [Nitrosopumilaceae archaeon]